jgi:c-di-GMP-binding flagellar brake protein YcgR
MKNQQYQREYFRYTFKEPIDLVLSIYKLHDKMIESKPTIAKMLDLSGGGLKMATALHFPMIDEWLLRLQFTVNQKSFNQIGRIKWSAPNEKNNGYVYGLEFVDIHEETQIEIIQLLNRLAIHDRMNAMKSLNLISK